MNELTESFPVEVVDNLKFYVYRLIDPRNGETFYVGKGKGNRVFAHIREQLSDDELGNKLKRIREIRLAGFEVAHVIHRHGMDEPTATEVEAALIDAYPGLTNVAGGTGSSDYGAMHAKEIIKRYCAEPAVFQHRAILISVNRTATETSLYEATRYAWKINKAKAEQADVILATRQGLIVGAFIAHRWLEATPENFPGREESPGRFGFEGVNAPPEMQRLYFGKRVPDAFRRKGAANPIKYTWSKPVVAKQGSNTSAQMNAEVHEIANSALTAPDIPRPDADWTTIQQFALTFNGYTAWGSAKKCAEIGNARRHGTLTELRTCLFFEQRRWRHFGDEPNEAAMHYIRGVVDQIRSRIATGNVD